MLNSAKKKFRVLILCGPSGSGKSILEFRLTSYYKNDFQKMTQVTTRQMRVGEKEGYPYLFIEPHTYSLLENVLIGRVGWLGDSSIFKSKYGTIPDFKEDKINTIILSEEGIDDFVKSENLTKIKDSLNCDIDYAIVGLDIDYDQLTDDDKNVRADRQIEDFMKEKSVLHKADIVFSVNKKEFVEPADIQKYLTKRNFL